jgi:hypothetical protein
MNRLAFLLLTAGPVLSFHRFVTADYHPDRMRWLRWPAMLVVLVLLCVPALTRVTEHTNGHPFNTKPKFSFRKAAEEPTQKIYLEHAALVSGAIPAEPDRSDAQHIADFAAMTASASHASASLRAPPDFPRTV